MREKLGDFEALVCRIAQTVTPRVRLELRNK